MHILAENIKVRYLHLNWIKQLYVLLLRMIVASTLTWSWNKTKWTFTRRDQNYGKGNRTKHDENH